MLHRKQLFPLEFLPISSSAINTSTGSLLPELLSEPDENPFRAPNVAESIDIFVLNHFADKRCAAFAEPGERIVNIHHGEHDA